MPKNLPKIALLFAGGATIQTESKKLVSVTREADIALWLAETPELGLIADIEPIFIFPDGSDIEPKNWIELAKTIAQNYKIYDGFVILHSIDSILYTSSALSFFLSNLTKPIVFTGSPLSPDITNEKALEGFIDDYRTLGVRANLINSIQVATMNVPEVSLLFGNQLIRANRARKSFTPTFNIFEADDADVLGTVDFGIKLRTEESKKRGSVKLEKFKDVNISVVRMHPGFRPDEFSGVLKEKPDAILIHSYMQKGLKKESDAYLRIAYQQNIPVILFNPFMQQTEKRPGTVSVSGISYEALYAKIHWVLGKAKSPQDVMNLIETNIVGEYEIERRKPV